MKKETNNKVANEITGLKDEFDKDLLEPILLFDVLNEILKKRETRVSNTAR